MSTTDLPVITPAATEHPSLRDVPGLQAALTEAISGEVRFDRVSRALYSTDASVYQIVPLGVVIPRTEADIVATVRICNRFNVPLVARGGGTSQAGQSIGPGVILDTSKYFNRVLEIDNAGRRARVQPGRVLDDLNHEVRPLGLQFAPDISTANRATIGGMVANNSSGARSVIYGKTIDHVLELKVVLADGSVVQCGPLEGDALEAKCSQPDLEGACYRVVRKLAEEHAVEIERRYPRILRRVGGFNLDAFVPDRRSAAGFNLAHLFVGSEGTLGIVVEAMLRLVELPRAKAVMVVQFAELLDALAATPAILAHHPAAVEVVDKYVLDSTKLNAESARLRDFLWGDPGAILLIEFYGETLDALAPRLDALEADLKGRSWGDQFVRATDPADQARIWKLRTLALGLSMAEKGDAKAVSFVEDTAVAPEHLHDYISEFLEIIARNGTKAGVYAHASVGCLHVRPVIDLKTAEGARRFQAIAEEVAALVLKYGGALSGEHGDGLVRSPFQEMMYGPVLYQAFRELKRTFDPSNLLNPGKIVDAPPLLTNLRFGSAYVTPELTTTFDFSADGGLVRSAELCAGVGECRKTRGGTMCPSFQATRDERDSTRGRANTLRLTLTGQLGFEGMTDPALKEVLDLCLECKACKAECPTNVDMARLKAEFLHQYQRVHGVPLRNQFFGHVARLSRWGSRLAPISNWAAQSHSARWLNERLLGIDRRREPPAFAARPFVRRFHRRDNRFPCINSHSVMLFADTFTNYHEPAIGTAAVDLLHRAGCDVVIAPHRGPSAVRCCGRPLISNGMLDQAVETARHNVERLENWASDAKPIIACEPSCILTIKDDYPALLRGEARAKAERVAAMCKTFEEFLESILAEPDSDMPSNATDLPSTLRFRPGPQTILVQGHCHQRSLVGMDPLLRLMRRIPGARVIDLDAGCCGLAGSFGYEIEHYALSRQVGEQRLFPALRAAGADAAIVAPGFSCRLQIQHFTARFAVHPAQLLHSLLALERPIP
jgi:FAD/FMN-containing dehydrogenase/Fe-S oxidoreductase